MQKRLRALDRLAIAGFEHDGIIIWSREEGMV